MEVYIAKKEANRSFKQKYFQLKFPSMQTENGAGTLAIFLKDCGHNLYVSSQSDVGKAIPFPAQKCHAQIGGFPNHPLWH